MTHVISVKSFMIEEGLNYTPDIIVAQCSNLLNYQIFIDIFILYVSFLIADTNEQKLIKLLLDYSHIWQVINGSNKISQEAYYIYLYLSK